MCVCVYVCEMDPAVNGGTIEKERAPFPGDCPHSVV